MKSYCKKLFFVFMSTLFLVSMLVIVVLPVLGTETFVWEGSVPANGDPVVSPILWQGVSYRIVANMTWWYNKPENLAADAQYYTTDFTNNWYWGNYAPEPNGHSFLQINGQDVDWGPFSNGDTGHTYDTYYKGEGTPVTFRLVDWMDENYTNNVCHLHVLIYKELTVGGHVVDSNVWELAPLLVIGGLAFAVIIAVPATKYLRKLCFQMS